MTGDVFIPEGELNLKDPPRLVWVRAREAARMLWRENPKLHDLQVLVSSIRRHAFQVPGKFDANLFRVGQPVEDEHPLGAIKAGNGRYEAVAWLEEHWAEVRQDEEGVPRGLALDNDGAWCVPVLIGTDAKSTSAAMEFAIDDNNAVAAGGDLDGFDMARLWDSRYTQILQQLDELPVTVDASILQALSEIMEPPMSLDELEGEYNEPDPSDGWPHIRVKVSPDTLELWESLMAQAPGKNDDEKVDRLLHCVDTAALADSKAL